MATGYFNYLASDPVGPVGNKELNGIRDVLWFSNPPKRNISAQPFLLLPTNVAGLDWPGGNGVDCDSKRTQFASGTSGEGFDCGLAGPIANHANKTLC